MYRTQTECLNIGETFNCLIDQTNATSLTTCTCMYISSLIGTLYYECTAQADVHV